ncbi:MAG: rhomboid family intramembrane serine protease [Anaerolinea sp.]|nr:rhomboid family intramembrane serine protease [Anaerolinea sp.]
MRTFLRLLWDNFIFVFKIAVGLLLTIGLLRFVRSPNWQFFSDNVGPDATVLRNVETAVLIVGGLFVVTWSVRFLDRSFYKGKIKQQAGLMPQSAQTMRRWFIHPFVHLDDSHLYSNTRNLLLFTGVAVLITPDLQTFLVASLAMLLVTSCGIWLFGQKGTGHIGASGILIGYFGFIITYGLAVMRDWRAVVALLLLLFFGRHIFNVLAHPGANVSKEGHFWGFIGGVVAALLLSSLMG